MAQTLKYVIYKKDLLYTNYGRKLMNTTFYNLDNKFNSLLLNKWLLLTLILFTFTLLSCNRSSSVRSYNKTMAKKVNREEAIIADNKKEDDSKENIKSSEFAELTKKMKNEPKIDEVPTKKLPTLVEQLGKLNEEQINIKSKMSDISLEMTNVKTDVKEIKGTLDEIKNAINTYYNNKPREAVTGIKPKLDEKKSENDENSKIISYDEFAQKDNKKKDYVLLSDEEIKPKAKHEVEKRKVKKVVKEVANDDIKPKKEKRITTEDRKALAKAIKDKLANDQIAEDNTPIANNGRPDAIEFKTAMSKISKKDYISALNDLQAAIKKEKDVVKRSECNYWIGESHYGLKQFDKAIESFMKVINTVRNSRQDDAQAMLAESQMRAGMSDKAKQSFSALINKYPDSEFVPRARKMLQQL